MTKALGRRVHKTIHHKFLTGLISTQINERVMIFWLFHQWSNWGQWWTYPICHKVAHQLRQNDTISFAIYLHSRSAGHIQHHCFIVFIRHSHFLTLRAHAHTKMQTNVSSMQTPSNLKYVALLLSSSLCLTHQTLFCVLGQSFIFSWQEKNKQTTE